MGINKETIEAVDKATKEYKYGFVTDIEMELAPKGLNKEIVKYISNKNNEPDWLLDWRLDAFEKWLKMSSNNPEWANIYHDPINFEDAYYLSLIHI